MVRRRRSATPRMRARFEARLRGPRYLSDGCEPQPLRVLRSSRGIARPPSKDLQADSLRLNTAGDLDAANDQPRDAPACCLPMERIGGPETRRKGVARTEISRGSEGCTEIRRSYRCGEEPVAAPPTHSSSQGGDGQQEGKGQGQRSMPDSGLGRGVDLDRHGLRMLARGVGNHNH